MNDMPSKGDTALPLELSAFQKAFNAELERFLDSKIRAHEAIPNSRLFLDALDHVRTLLLSGGKRIRPYMCYLAYETEKGTSADEVFSVGIALEIFHMFALVHDDIIDRGLTRHGVSTTHIFIANSIGDMLSRDVRHIGEAIALLAGDLLFSWSYELICQSKNSEVMAIFSHMVSEVVAGQAIDVSLTLKSAVTAKEILEKNELKTARYTFVNPLQMGRALAGSANNSDIYTHLGLCLGQAFQIQDDLLDVLGTVAVTGKEPFIDVEEGQHTLLTQYVFEHAHEKDRAVLASVFGKKLSADERVSLATLFESTNAIGYARENIQSLLNEAEGYSAGLPELYQPYWSKIVSLLAARVS